MICFEANRSRRGVFPLGSAGRWPAPFGGPPNGICGLQHAAQGDLFPASRRKLQAGGLCSPDELPIR
jgi:hypothetical protein